MDLNKVTLIGNMVRDPESRTLPSGQRIARFSLATNYRWHDAKTKAKKESVDYHAIIAWGRLADILQQYVRKGSKLYVEGRLHTRQFVAKDGQKKSAPEVIADNFIMLGHRTVRSKDTAMSDKLVREDVDVDEAENE